MKASQQQATKIFVGGLSQETENADLIDAFSPYGTVVDAICVLDPNTNRKRGTFLFSVYITFLFLTNTFHLYI